MKRQTKSLSRKTTNSVTLAGTSGTSSKGTLRRPGWMSPLRTSRRSSANSFGCLPACGGGVTRRATATVTDRAIMSWNVMLLGLAAANPGHPATATTAARTRSRKDRGMNVLLGKGTSMGRAVASRRRPVPWPTPFRRPPRLPGLATRAGVQRRLEFAVAPVPGFTAPGAEASELMAVAQTAMLGGMPYTALRDTIWTHPTAAEGLLGLFANPPAAPVVG